MKKIVYLLLISLLFASCKKKANQAETKAPLLKGKWKIQSVVAKRFDADGNLIDTEHSEVPESEVFYLEFDGNNRVFYINLDDTDEKSGFYTYQNGYLAVSNLDNEINPRVFVSQLTPNNMTWQMEPEEINLEPEEINLEPEEINFDNLEFQNHTPQQIGKIFVYYHFDKVK